MKTLVALSGGMDSATVLATALNFGTVETVGFTYGSKHNKWENEAARKVAEHYQVPFQLIDISGVMTSFRSHLLQSGGDIPEGHYQTETMKQTVVPGRNSIFTSILLGLAQSTGADEVWIGIHAGDHAIYCDCRPAWHKAMNQVYKEASEGNVSLVAPFLKINKRDILTKGLMLQVPYQLTRTCYKDQPISCGRCGSCQERLESFRLINTQDPIEYEFRGELPK